eukprot:XP_019072356.1 PREDICTED: protein MRG1 isoform X3 [Vitis vinifera]
MGSSVDASATETDGDTTETDIDVDADSDTDDYPPLSDSCPFSEGEKVLAYHNLRIYPAKVRRIEFQMNEWKYFVHYLGWSKNWDEWVGMDRLLKFSEENVQKQKALGKKQGIDKNTKPVRASQIKPKNFARGKKWKNDCVTKLIRLPRAPTVDKILKKYLDYRIKRDGMISDSAGEILKGLRCYFDKALPVMLLYERERQQYQEAIANNVSPSTIYGAEHLLRLFVKLPELLFHANIEKETSKELQMELLDFLKFLQKNQSAFFLTSYISSA